MLAVDGPVFVQDRQRSRLHPVICRCLQSHASQSQHPILSVEKHAIVTEGSSGIEIACGERVRPEARAASASASAGSPITSETCCDTHTHVAADLVQGPEAVQDVFRPYYQAGGRRAGMGTFGALGSLLAGAEVAACSECERVRERQVQRSPRVD